MDANASPRVEALEELPGKANYFLGNDPTKWRTNVPTYARVHYQDLYPGIDLIYYGNQRQLEYDLVVRPGADPSRIRLGVQGADTLDVDAQGDLVLHTAGGDIRQRKPAAYQEIDGMRQEISGGYVLKGSHTVGFEVGAYDASRPLVIDPVLFYSTYLGGSSDDFGSGIAVDSSGDAYVTGYTLSTDFPTTVGAFQTTHAADGGLDDGFVTKLNPTGAALVYSTYLGGSSDDFGFGIAVDSSGDAYVTGYTLSTAFPTTVGAFQMTNAGGYDGFVTKLNPTGAALVYSTYLGGSSDDFGRGIAVDAAGSAYVTGYTYSTAFPTTVGAFQTTHAADSGRNDAFVTKLNPTGAGLVYSTYLGGNSFDVGLGIAVDALGSAYVTGGTQSTNFPTTTRAFQTTFGGGVVDGFVTKLNPAGSMLDYSTYLGGTGLDTGFGIAVDTLPNPNAYVVGYTNSTDFPTTPRAFQTTVDGGFDAFVVKIADIVLPPSFTGKVTGDGSINVVGGIGTFGFIVQAQTTTGPVSGELQYVNHANGAKVHSVMFTALVITGNMATFSGTCTNNGVPCTFSVDVTDNGEPGDMDTFTISISAGSQEGGTLRSGNIQIHD